jgi:hypothetical protein
MILLCSQLKLNPADICDETDIAKLFITDKEAKVESLGNKIMKDKLSITPGWMAARS